MMEVMYIRTYSIMEFMKVALHYLTILIYMRLQ